MHRLATNGREFLFSNIYTNSLHTNNFRSRQILFYRLKSDSSSSTTTENLQSVQPNNESPLTKKILNQQSQQNPNQSRKPQQHNTNYQHGTPLKNSQPQPNKQPSFLEKLSLNYIQQKPQRQSTNQNNEQKPSQNQQQNQPKNFNNQQQNKNKSNQNQRNNMNQQNSQNQKNNQNQQNQPRNFNQQNNQFNNSQNQRNSTNQVQQNQQNQQNQQSQQNQSNQQNQSQKKVGYSSEFMEKLIKSAPNYKSGQNTQYQQNKPNEQNYQNQKNNQNQKNHQKQKSFQQKPREFQKGNNRNSKNHRDNNGRNTRFQDNDYEEYTPIEIEPRPRFPQQPKIKDVTLPVPVTVKGLAQILGTRVVDILKTMITMGEKPSSHIEPLPRDLAEVICQEYGFTVLKTSNKLDIHRTPLPEDKSKLSPRPPVVVVMGHINHGKTSILDALRKTQMADREAGKITQAISSFQHTTSSGAKITFMDTPGHEAFSKMRERGSQITDLAILVVAADEGVKEQTIEAIEHIKSAKLLPIVAINKVDKEGADVNKVKQQLAQHEIYTEDHGGDIVAVPISARSGTGLTDLEEAILFQSEVLELRADPTQRGEATVVESFMHKGFGPVANTIIRNGTIKTGDYFVVGKTYGRVRFLFDADGKNMKSAGPSAAVQIVGLRNLAEPADDVIILDNEDFARQVAEYRIREGELEVAKQGRFDLIKAVKAGEKSFLPFNDQPVEDEIEEEVEEEEESDINEQKEFNVFIKGDSGGSIEAVIQAINELPHDPEISVKVLKTSIGVVTQSDLFLADTAKGIFLSFNVSNTQKMILAAQQQGTPIIESKIIYEIVEKLKTKLESTLSPITSISTIGSAEVKMIFPINKKKNVFQNVAGCLVKQGSIKRSSTIEVHRNGSKIWEGKISSLKHIKNDINEAKNNTECGIALDGFDDLKEGDVFQAIDVTKTPRKLGESLVPNKR